MTELSIKEYSGRQRKGQYCAEKFWSICNSIFLIPQGKRSLDSGVGVHILTCFCQIRNLTADLLYTGFAFSINKKHREIFKMKFYTDWYSFAFSFPKKWNYFRFVNTFLRDNYYRKNAFKCWKEIVGLCMQTFFRD